MLYCGKERLASVFLIGSNDPVIQYSVFSTKRLLLWTLIVAVWSSHPASAQPENNRFESATPITGDAGSVVGTNVGANGESGEPLTLIGHESTVWWRLTPETTGRMEIDTFGSDFDTTLVVFRGTDIRELTILGANDDQRNLTSGTSVPALAGQPIEISVGGFRGREGNITLNWNLSTSPTPNDAFSDSLQLDLREFDSPGGAFGETTIQENIVASSEVGEASISSEETPNSVWFHIDAPYDDETLFVAVRGVDDSFENFVLDAFVGQRVDQLTRLASRMGAGASLALKTDAGVRYYIGVAGKQGFRGNFVVEWSLGPAPINDDIANATALSGPQGRFIGTNTFATSEPFELDAVNLEKTHQSVWYRWVAADNGQLTLNPLDTNFNYRIAVYEGDGSESVRLLGGNSSRIGIRTIEVSEGNSYYIQFLGGETTPTSIKTGRIILEWMADSPGIAPPLSGWYWNPNEPGRGWNIEIRGSTLFMAGFLYGDDGEPVWYTASGELDSDRFIGELLISRNGQTLSGPYVEPDNPELVTPFELLFIEQDRAEMRLTDGTVIDLFRFEF